MALSNTADFSRDKPLFQLFFLKDNEENSVKVEEVADINFTEVKLHLERGESVFITRKRIQNRPRLKTRKN